MTTFFFVAFFLVTFFLVTFFLAGFSSAIGSIAAIALPEVKKEDQNPHIIEDATVHLEKLGELFSIIKKINKS